MCIACKPVTAASEFTSPALISAGTRYSSVRIARMMQTIAKLRRGCEIGSMETDNVRGDCTRPVEGFTLGGVPIDLSNFAVVLLDLDGTIYHEDHPLPGAVQLIRKLQTENRRFACLSNSSSSPLRVMQRLHGMGVELEPDQIYTAAAAACDYIVQHFPEGSLGIQIPGHPVRRRPRVFNLATESMQEMLEGLVDWVQSGGEPCDAVFAAAPSCAFATEERQRIALQLLRRGATLVGLCADRVYPSPRGLEFGSGAMCAMLSYAANLK